MNTRGVGVGHQLDLHAGVTDIVIDLRKRQNISQHADRLVLKHSEISEKGRKDDQLQTVYKLLPKSEAKASGLAP